MSESKSTHAESEDQSTDPETKNHYDYCIITVDL